MNDQTQQPTSKRATQADDDDELTAPVADSCSPSTGSRGTAQETSAARLEEVVQTVMHLGKLRGEARVAFYKFVASATWKRVEAHIESLLLKVDAATEAEFRARMRALDVDAGGALKDAP